MPSGAQRESLHQEWVHSHEEDQGDDMVFRPSSFEFPPSRGRRSIELRRDGTLGHARPGPSDRPERVEGHWEIDGNRLKLFRAAAPTPTEVLEIVAAAPDRLVLRRRK